MKVVLGGVAGLSITQVVLWWGFHNDPFDLGKTLGANSITRFVVPKVYWPQTDDGTGTPANGAPTKGSSSPTAGVGGAHAPPSGGFNSKVDWNSVVTGAPEGGAKGTTPAKADAEPLLADFDVPGAKPVDPLAFDLGDPLKLDPAAASKPASPAAPASPATPPEPAPKQDEPAAPAKVPAKPAAEARTVADLNAALEVVRQASQSWRDVATGEKDQRRKAAETLYLSLARLGEVANHVDDDDAALPDALGEIGRHVAELSADVPTGRIIEVLCAAALDNAERQTPGIAVLGTVQATEQQGTYYVTEVVLATKEPRTVRVLSAVEPEYEAGSKVLILGLVVDTSAQPLDGFSGEAGQVVVTRRTGLRWGS